MHIKQNTSFELLNSNASPQAAVISARRSKTWMFPVVWTPRIYIDKEKTNKFLRCVLVVLQFTVFLFKQDLIPKVQAKPSFKILADFALLCSASVGAGCMACFSSCKHGAATMATFLWCWWWLTGECHDYEIPAVYRHSAGIESSGHKKSEQPLILPLLVWKSLHVSLSFPTYLTHSWSHINI